VHRGRNQRPRISSTCRRCTECASDWSVSVLALSTRSAPSCSSVGSRSGRDNASCGPSYRASWLCPPVMVAGWLLIARAEPGEACRERRVGSLELRRAQGRQRDALTVPAPEVHPQLIRATRARCGRGAAPSSASGTPSVVNTRNARQAVNGSIEGLPIPYHSAAVSDRCWHSAIPDHGVESAGREADIGRRLSPVEAARKQAAGKTLPPDFGFSQGEAAGRGPPLDPSPASTAALHRRRRRPAQVWTCR
jgi:hypothetical protein